MRTAIILALLIALSAVTTYAARTTTELATMRGMVERFDWQCDLCPRAAQELDLETRTELCKDHARGDDM